MHTVLLVVQSYLYSSHLGISILPVGIVAANFIIKVLKKSESLPSDVTTISYLILKQTKFLKFFICLEDLLLSLCPEYNKLQMPAMA